MRHDDHGMLANPDSAVDVLAFVLCPARAFAPGGDAAEISAVKEIMKPMKAEACRRFARAAAQRRRH